MTRRSQDFDLSMMRQTTGNRPNVTFGDAQNHRPACLEFKDVVHSTWVEGLDFVPAGTLDTPVGALLSGDRIERFLNHAGKQYDFILLDVPPILPVSDGLVIARAAGAAIFCALRDVSTVANISRAVDKLKAAEVNVLGAVFNGVPAREYGGDRYYYYRIPTGSAGAAKSL